MRIILDEKEHLLCMPYLKVGKDQTLFDLQIEEFRDAIDLIDYIKDIFSGAKIKDKYGNKIQISSYEDKKALAYEIKNNSFIYQAIIAKMTSGEKKLLDIILNF